MVVIVAFRIPILRPTTSTTGVMQFVVQLAQEMIFNPASGHVCAVLYNRSNVFVFRGRRSGIYEACPSGDMFPKIFTPS